MYQVVHASAMQVLKFKDCKVGMRTYLLVAGGFDMPKIMAAVLPLLMENSADTTDVPYAPEMCFVYRKNV